MGEHLHIYALKNTVNGKFYVGSSSAPERRFHRHMIDLKTGRHPNHEMKEDYRRFGECFELKVLGIKKHNRAESEEFYWMKILRTYDERFGYNTHDIAMNPARKAAGLPYKTSPRKGRKFKE